MSIDIEEVAKILQKHGTSWNVTEKLKALGTKEEVADALWRARKAGKASLVSANYTLYLHPGAPSAWDADDLCSFVNELQQHFPDGVFNGGASGWTRALPGSADGLMKMLEEKREDTAFGAAMRTRWAALPRYWGTTVAYFLVLNGQMPEEELPGDVLRAIAKAYLNRRDAYEFPEVNRWLSIVLRARFQDRVLEVALGAPKAHSRWEEALVEVALGPDPFEIQMRATAAELLPHVALEDVTKVLARLPEDTSSTYAGEGFAPVNLLPSDDPLEAIEDKVDLAWLERAIVLTETDARRQPRNALLGSYVRRCVKERAVMSPSIDAALTTFLGMYPVGTSTNQESLVEALRLMPEARLEAFILHAKRDQWGLVAHCPTQKVVDHAMASLATLLDPKQARYQPWEKQRYAPLGLATWKPSAGAEAVWSWAFRAKTVAPALAQVEVTTLSPYARYLLIVVLATSGSVEALTSLFDALETRDETQRTVALFGLVQLGADACLPALKERVGDRKKERREGAAQVLAALSREGSKSPEVYALAVKQAKVERIAAIKAVLETVRPLEGEESSLADRLLATDGAAWTSHTGDAKELVEAFRIAFASRKEVRLVPADVTTKPVVLLGAVTLLPIGEDLKARFGSCPFWYHGDESSELSQLFTDFPESEASAEASEDVASAVSDSVDALFATIETHVGETSNIHCGVHAEIDVATAAQAFADDGYRVVRLQQWPPRPAVARDPLWLAWVAALDVHRSRSDARALSLDVLISAGDKAWSMLEALGEDDRLLAEALETRLSEGWPKRATAFGPSSKLWPVNEALSWLIGRPLAWSGPCWVAALALPQKESALARRMFTQAGVAALPFLVEGLAHAQVAVRRASVEVLDALRLPESLPALEAAAIAHPKETAIRALIAALKSSELNLELLPLGASGDALLDAAVASLPCPPWTWAVPFASLPKLRWLGGASVSDAAAQWFIAAIGNESETQREPKLALIRARLTDASCGAVLAALFTHGHTVEGEARFLKKFAFATCFLGDDAALDETARNLENVVHIASGRYGRDALDGLARRGTPAAVRALEWASRRSGSSTIKRRSVDALAEMAGWRGLSVPELLDEALSDFGFDAKGELAFDLAGRTLTLKLGRDNAVEILDAEGHVLKALPAARKTDDAEAYAQAKKSFSTLKKSLATAHTSQRKRLESYLASERTWFANAWRERFLGHPLMHTYARTLLWEAIDARDLSQAKFVVMESDLMSTSLDTVTLDASWRVRLLHPLGMPPAEVAAWSEVFADNQILPLFPQLTRPTYPRAASDTALLDEMPNVTCGPWMGGMARCGYEQGPRGDGGNIYSTVRTVGRYVVTIEHEGYWPSDPNWAFALHRIVVTEAGQVVPWTALSEVFASELGYDLRRLTGAVK